MLSAEIIAVGSELLTPEKTDTNSLWLTEKLMGIGVEVKLKTIVGDDEARLEETIRDALKRSDIVITTGGLGPTKTILRARSRLVRPAVSSFTTMSSRPTFARDSVSGAARCPR